MKKRFLAAVLALAMLLMMVPSAFAASDGFDDVPGHWAEDAINRWSGYGVVNGVGDNQFAPNGTLTRAQAAQVFANLLDLEVQADISRYTDVPEGSWYHTAIAQCVAAGILTGTGGATMDPQSPVTREELFVMFARALNIRPQSSSDVTFGDSGEVSGWAQGYINALADRGFVSGVGGGMLAPGEAINRASVMSLLDKTISDYANTSGTTVGNASGVVLVVADNVSVAGDVDTLVVYGGSASVTGSQVAEATVAGENASLSVSGSAVVERVDVAGAEAVLTLTGSVRAGQVTVSGESAQVSLSGQAQAASVAVEETAAGAGLTVGAGSAVTTVDSAAANVTISGSGTVETANVSGNNTTVNTDGTDLTVAQGTTGVTENNKPVSGGTTVETQPEQPVTPPVHIHSYIATEIKAVDDDDITVGVKYTCYAGDHSYIELNDNAAAQVGSDYYYVDVSKALSEADNATVTMLKDAVFTDTCIVTGTVTLNMNGRTISNTSDIWNQDAGKWSLISVQENGDLTITGSGTLSTKENDIYAVDVHDAASSCTIESGTFIGNVHAVYVRNGELTVNGGHFSVQQKYSQEQPDEFVLNCFDANYKAGTAKITVTGGTFENFNPADCEAEGKGTNFVAKGYTVTSKKNGEDTWYTVVPLTAENAAAEVNGVYYENLTDAIAAADGGTVTMLKDAVFTDTCIVTGTVTLDMNGRKISNTSGIWDQYAGKWSLISVRGNGDLTITGNGTLSTLKDDIYAVDVYDDTSSCTIESGTFIGNVHAVYVRNGELTVNGGHFSVQQKYSQEQPYEFVLNCYDEHYKAKTARITVTGGTFENFNPADCEAEGEGTDFVAEGYTVTKNGERFTVIPVPEGVIAVNDEAGLNEALSQVRDGGTIMLAGDITLTSPLTIDKNVTLMGYGDQIVAGGFEGHYVSIGSSVTNVTIQNVAFANPTNQNDNASCLYASRFGGKLVIEGCTFTDTQWDSIQITPVNGADITITGCTFTNPNSTSHRYLHIEATDTSGACTAKVTVTNNHFGTGDKVNNSIIDIDYIDYRVNLIAGGNTFEDATVADGDIFVCKTYPDDVLDYAEAYNWFVEAI